MRITHCWVSVWLYSADLTEVALAALSLGMIFVGTCHNEVGLTIIQRLMESSEEALDHHMTRYMCLGLGLLFLQRTENADAMLEACKTIEHPKIGKYLTVTLEGMCLVGRPECLCVCRGGCC